MGVFNKKKKDEVHLDGTLASYPYLCDIKPNERYVFHSDYYEVDDGFATILSFFHIEGANDDFGPFWGVNKIPGGLDRDVSIVLFQQDRRMTEGWLRDHQTKAEGVANMNENEQQSSGSNTSKGKASRRTQDLQVVAQELQDGAAYICSKWKLQVKAPTLESLDNAIDKISRSYIDLFGSVSVAAYPGEQRNELSRLFAKNEKTLGHGFYFTSTEFAGMYSLVTHGLEDPTGEYIGYMVGDVNNSAVLFDVNKYSHHIVIANENFDHSFGNARVYVSDTWGSKISQACLINRGKVVHIILDGANLNMLGPKFPNITYRVNMSHGDVNMFEMFGETKDELSIFPSQMQKLILMAEQAYETTDSDRSIIRGELESIATKFYIDNRMWYENAGRNRSKLRIVGIPHEEVPKLEMFCTYLNTEYKALLSASAKDSEAVHAMKVLSTTFANLLSNNGDLFNTTTNSVIDGAKNGKRVIYDFSALMRRGKGVAMAQLVNIIGFAVGNLGEGDTVIIHGAERIDDGVKTYINQQFASLYEKGGRVCYLYNDVDKMLSDKSFNEFDKADYTILGNMTDTTISDYQKALGQAIPADLASLITNKSDSVCYIRRDFDNVVFQQELTLHLPKKGDR